MRPARLRPPRWLFPRVSRFSGVVVVSSSNVWTVWNRRPGEVGRDFLIAIYEPLVRRP